MLTHRKPTRLVRFVVMAIELKEGDVVSFLDEVGGGRILAVQKPGLALVETDEGFRVEMPTSSLVLRQDQHESELLKVTDQQVLEKAQAETPDPKRVRAIYEQPTGKRSKREKDSENTMEIDLHLHQILDDERGMTAGEKLNYQLNYFERMLSKAIGDKKRKLVVIHGIGEGKLRGEIRRILKHYPGVRYHDGDPKKYGSGATEILLHGN